MVLLGRAVGCRPLC